MIRVAHLSDPHFGTEDPAVMTALEQILAETVPDVTLFSGDITQRARFEQFEAARLFFAKLPGEKLVIPGNHDIPLYDLVTRFLRPYEKFRAAFGVRNPRVQYANLTLVGLDATTPFKHTKGVLNLENTRSVLQDLSKARDSQNILGLVIHQPLFVATREDELNLLINAEEIAALFGEYKVDLVFSGHIHLPFCETAAAIRNDLASSFIFFGAGTVISKRVRYPAPNSFYFLEIDTPADSPFTISNTRYDFNATKGSFERHSKDVFVKNEGGWVRDREELRA